MLGNTVVWAIISPTLSPIIAPKYKELGKHKKAYWYTLLGSSFHTLYQLWSQFMHYYLTDFSNEYISLQSAIRRSLIEFDMILLNVDMTLCMLDNEMCMIS